VRKLLILFTAFFVFGCNSPEEPSSKVDQRPYASAKLEMMALENKYLLKIDRLLSKEELPREVKENLKIVKDFIEGRMVDPYSAYEALEKLEKLQAKEGLRLFSALQLRELKELIEMKARYSTPPVA